MSIGCVSVATITRTANDHAENELITRWAGEADHACAAKMGNVAIRQRFLLGRSLVRALVDRATDVGGHDCEILSAPDGKPFLRLASGAKGPAVSISHSGAMIVAAATDLGAVGVDVEFHRLDRPFDALATFAFGPLERRVAGQSPQAFYRTWCLREAMSKATGRGLSEATDRIDRVSGSPAFGAWEAKIDSATWLLAHIAPAANYSLAIAIDLDDPDSPLGWTEASLDLWDPMQTS